MRARLQGICRAAGAPFDTLDIAVIDVPVLRLDHGQDRTRLLETVERIRPRLLVLDPLVRLHGIDENAAGEVAPILGFLRSIQRRSQTAVLLVHHARKSGGRRPGQALRGSSELHDYAPYCTSLSGWRASSGKRLRFESSRLGCLVGGGSGISIK